MARPQRTIDKTSITTVLPERPKRPEVKKEFKLQGGWIFNTTEECKKRKIDSDKIWSTETAMCIYCNDKIKCKAFEWLQQGRKDRIKYRTEGEV